MSLRDGEEAVLRLKQPPTKKKKKELEGSKGVRRE